MAVYGKMPDSMGCSIYKHCWFGDGQNISHKPENLKGCEVQGPSLVYCFCANEV